MQRCLGCMREFGDEYNTCPHCGYVVGSAAASKNHLAPGTVLQDRYTLGRALGQGGFGVTYIAWDNKIGRAVAIKEYMPNAFASRITGEKDVSCYNEEAQRQFDLGLEKTRKETNALSQFSSLESVVNVYDFIEENNTAYIIMELLNGKTVKEILSARGKLTFAETMQIMTPVLLTLDAMHSIRMIHRDVAPDNIFVCQNGKIKLLDFGAARVVSEADDQTLSVILKRGFAPVEQYSSKAKQGPYTDVYAASATIYYMLTGKMPPDSLSRVESESELLAALSGSDAPSGAQETVLHGMALKPNERIQSTRELLLELKKEKPVNGVRIDPQKIAKKPKTKRNKKALLIIAAAVIVVLAVVFSKEGSGHKGTESPASAANAETSASDPKATEPAKTDTKWIELYKNYLLEEVKQNQEDNPDADDNFSMTQFSLIYLDDDDVPELVVSEGGFHVASAKLVTCYGGTLYSFFPLGSYGGFQYKERQGILTEGYSGSGASSLTVWRLTQGSLKCVWSGHEWHPELMYEDGGTPEYYIQDAEDLETLLQSQSESDPAEETQIPGKKVSEAEYSAAYSANVPAGQTAAYPDNYTFTPITQKNVETYFAALADPDSVTTILAYTKLSLSGTVSEVETDYNDKEYRVFELDKPVVVRFTGDAFPALLTSVQINGSDLKAGHASLTVDLYSDSDGTVQAYVD